MTGAAVLIGATATPSRAYTITFDDLSGDLGYIPDGYADLDWNNFYYANPVDNGYTDTGYNVGTISSPNIALNGFGAPTSITSSTPFTLQSGYFTDAFEDGDTITVTGDVNGVATYTTNFTIDSESPTFETFDWNDLDEVDFNDEQGSQFALDNLSLVPSTPEPASPLTMLVGVLGLVLCCTQKRIKSELLAVCAKNQKSSTNPLDNENKV